MSRQTTTTIGIGIGIGIGAGVILLMLALPGIANQGIVFFAAVTYVYIVFAFSWNLMFGYTGMASFGHGAFFAIGGYGCGVLLVHVPQINFLLAILATGLLGLIVGVVVGFVVRRAHGVYFAIFTIALAQVVYLLVANSSFLGRDDGFTGISRPQLHLGVATIDLSVGNHYYYFIVAASLVLTAGLWRFVHGPVGRRLKAIQQDSERAAFLGVNVGADKLLSFSVAGMVAAMSGALYAPLLQIVTPELTYFVFSAQPVLYTMLGGMSSFWGPAIGGVVFAALSYLTRTLVGLSEVITGLTLLVVVLALPTGIFGLGATLRRRSAGNRKRSMT